MAKLPRVLQRIFGSGAGTDQIAQFGSLNAGTPAFTTSPATAQSLSNWLTGWFGAVIGGNAPAIEDMNAAMFVMTYQLAYLFQAGIPEWDATTTYYTGSLVNDGQGSIFKSITDTNLNNAITDPANWRLVVGTGLVVTSKSANGSVSVNDGFLPCSAASGSFALALPAASDVKGKPIYFKKVDSTSNVVTLQAAGADSIDGQTTLTLTIPNESAMLLSDGVGTYSVF